MVAPGYDPRPLTVADVATNMTARDLVTARPDQDLEEGRALLAAISSIDFWSSKETVSSVSCPRPISVRMKVPSIPRR